MEKQGAEITYLNVNKDGLIEVSDIEKAIKENTFLISVMYANNEIGTIQPIAEIGALLKKINSPKIKNSLSKIYFHTDAVQAANYLDCDVKKIGVDLLTLSGHKIYGPKGIGVLYVKQGIPIESLVYGGGQEQGLRSGTENVPAIVGMGKAIEEIGKNKPEIKKIRDLRDKLVKGILQKIPKARLNGSKEKRIPNNANISIPGVEGESLVIALDQEGIAVSTGSACSSKDLKPSHVLLAIGLSPKEAHGSLRITLGKYTTEEEIEKALKAMPKVVEKLRKISPFK